MGYWASAYPEGDGITFKYTKDSYQKSSIEILEDFSICFEWVEIELAKSRSSNLELAELEGKNKNMECIVIVPIEKIFIQETIEIGKYIFIAEDNLMKSHISDYQSKMVRIYSLTVTYHILIY